MPPHKEVPVNPESQLPLSARPVQAPQTPGAVPPLPYPVPTPFAGPWEYALRFPGDPRGPGVARATLRAVLTAHHLGELADRAELLTSELTTNAVRYSKGPAAVLLRWAAPILRVSVSDPCPEFPAPRVPVGPVAADAERGRGLLILDLLADAWGDCCAEEPALGSVGKSIWFELILGAGPPSPEAPALAA